MEYLFKNGDWPEYKKAQYFVKKKCGAEVAAQYGLPHDEQLKFCYYGGLDLGTMITSGIEIRKWGGSTALHAVRAALVPLYTLVNNCLPSPFHPDVFVILLRTIVARFAYAWDFNKYCYPIHHPQRLAGYRDINLTIADPCAPLFIMQAQNFFAFFNDNFPEYDVVDHYILEECGIVTSAEYGEHNHNFLLTIVSAGLSFDALYTAREQISATGGLNTLYQNFVAWPFLLDLIHSLYSNSFHGAELQGRAWSSVKYAMVARMEAVWGFGGQASKYAVVERNSQVQ